MSEMWNNDSVLVNDKCWNYCEEKLHKVLNRLYESFRESP